MDLVKKHWPLVQFLSKSQNDKAIKSVLENLTKTQIRLLSEIALNVLVGNIVISRYYKQKLLRHKNIIISWSEKTSKRKSFSSNLPLVKDLLKASYNILQAQL
jgi:hypothetical protein